MNEVGKTGKRILVAEDSQINQMFAEKLLTNFGFTVTIAENGAVAVSEYQSGDYDLILMDIQMPEMDGFEATAQIRQYDRDNGRSPITIIAMTANDKDEDRQKCLAAGMDDYLAKPVRKKILQDMLEKHLKITLDEIEE